MNSNQLNQKIRVITVVKKPTRNRGATWADDEIAKLLQIWSRPEISRAFLSEKKKSEIFAKVASELGKLGVRRSIEECRAKIKNLKGEFRRAKEIGIPQTFRFYSSLEKILLGSTPTTTTTTFKPVLQEQSRSSSSANSNCAEDVIMQSSHSQQQHPVEIEFEIESNVDFQTMKGAPLPIEITGGNVILDDYTTEEVEEASMSIMDPLEGPDGTPLIVIATTAPENNRESFGIHRQQSASIKRSYDTSSYTDEVTMNTSEISQKRRKLRNISDQMADTVSRILTQTTQSIITEMKASEERFMQWEEKRRQEEQKREETMLKKLVSAVTSQPQSHNIDKHPRNGSENILDRDPSTSTQTRRNAEAEQLAESDPCAVIFDVLGKKLNTMLEEQSKATEDSLIGWEQRMQRQELRHTENIFNIILNSVNTNQ